jgi:hypothetical protein
MPDTRRAYEPTKGCADAEDRDETVDHFVAAAGGQGNARPVTALNPDAGQHVVTTDPRELRAALCAGKRTHRRFRYYEQRYGDRGRAFTRSDSAWIVTLAEHSPGVAEQQLRWLGALLAARGMPRWLLEVHLEALHAELVAAVPEKQARYDTLLQVAATLRDERLSHLDEATSSGLIGTFQRRLGSAPGTDLPEAGALIVAAVADERAGVYRAVDSLMEWLADPARFTDEWVTAVTETVAAARKLARGPRQ